MVVITAEVGKLVKASLRVSEKLLDKKFFHNICHPHLFYIMLINFQMAISQVFQRKPYAIATEPAFRLSKHN